MNNIDYYLYSYQRYIQRISCNNPYQKILVEKDNAVDLENTESTGNSSRYKEIMYGNKKHLIISEQYDNALNLENHNNMIIILCFVNMVISIFLCIYGGNYAYLYSLTIISQLFFVYSMYYYNYNIGNLFKYYTIASILIRSVISVLYSVEKENKYAIIYSWILLFFEVIQYLLLYLYVELFDNFNINISNNIHLHRNSNVSDTRFNENLYDNLISSTQSEDDTML